YKSEKNFDFRFGFSVLDIVRNDTFKKIQFSTVPAYRSSWSTLSEYDSYRKCMTLSEAKYILINTFVANSPSRAADIPVRRCIRSRGDGGLATARCGQPACRRERAEDRWRMASISAVQ